MRSPTACSSSSRRPRIPTAAEATYFFRPRAGFDTSEFYADARYGEMWVGRRPTVVEASQRLGIEVRHIDELRDHLAKDVGRPAVAVDPARRWTRPSSRWSRRSARRTPCPAGTRPTAEFAQLREVASEQRLVKDEYEMRQMREAVAATIRGFEDVIARLPEAVGHSRGERVIEGVFAAAARLDGNGVGYDTIAAAGDHACTLHWTRNDGAVSADELVLIDAGVEIDSLYTADVTRTLPVSGTFSPSPAPGLRGRARSGRRRLRGGPPGPALP